MTVDTEKMKALALAATPGPWQKNYGNFNVIAPNETNAGLDRYHVCMAEGRDYLQMSRNAEFIATANPAAVHELCTEVERLRAELATRCRAEGGDTSENMVLGKRAENDAKSAGTRMGIGFAGAGQIAAPASGTEKDAERLLAAIVRSDVGIATRHKLEDGQGTATEDGKNWMAAIEFVAAISAHTKAGKPA
jgi:hypothetical protein